MWPDHFVWKIIGKKIFFKSTWRIPFLLILIVPRKKRRQYELIFFYLGHRGIKHQEHVDQLKVDNRKVAYQHMGAGHAPAISVPSYALWSFHQILTLIRDHHLCKSLLVPKMSPRPLPKIQN